MTLESPKINIATGREPWYTGTGQILRPHQGVLAATDSANRQLSTTVRPLTAKEVQG